MSTHMGIMSTSGIVQLVCVLKCGKSGQMGLCRDQLRGPVSPPSFQLSVSQILYSLLICCSCKMKTGTSLKSCTSFFMSILHIFMNYLNLPVHTLSVYAFNPFLSLIVCFLFLFDVKLLIFPFYWFAVVCTNQRSVLVVGVSVSKNSEPAMTG